MQSLNEEVQKIEMDEEDDKAMGQEPSAEQVAENGEVSLASLSQILS